MKASVRAGLTMAIVVLLAFVQVAPALAVEPGPFTGTYVVTHYTDPYMWGHFEFQGTIQDSGNFVLTWEWQREMYARGTQTFEGKKGNITIEWTARGPQGGDSGYGKFWIVSGTGEYLGLEGEGDFSLCRPDWGKDIFGSLSGVIK